MDRAQPEKQFSQDGDRQEYLLSTLLDSVAHTVFGANQPAGRMVSGVTVDSRKVEAGSLFVALTGMRTDGHAYLEQVMAGGRSSSIPGTSDTRPSLAGGCAAVVVEEGRVTAEQLAGCSQCVIVVADSHLAYAQIAANLYGRPAQDLTLVGITGTNGKTTVSYLLDSVLRGLSRPVGVIGTVNYRYRDARGQDVEIPATFTTPEPLLLQGLLKQMADAGVTHVIMEVSSHALVQRRLGDLKFDVVAFTNLSRDHLDFHREMDDYFAAKALLFRDHLQAGGKAVITRSVGHDPDEETRARQLVELAAGRGAQVWQCGRVNDSDIYPLAIQSGLNSTTLSLHLPEKEVQVTTPLVGDFNVANLQTVMGIGLALGVEAEALSALLRHAPGAPGRMQRVMPAGQEVHFRPAVFVDYAHTPDALEKVLEALSRLPHRRLICVFGCGGDRDKGKRAIMGEIAGRRCDVALVTDDNPRSESPREIIAQIVSGVRLSGLEERPLSWLMASTVGDKGFLVMHSRAQAIALAIGAATAEDIVLIAGKGHELYQLGEDGSYFFDDSLEAKKGLTTWKYDSLVPATHGELIGDRLGARVLGEVVIDSRKVAAGDIFVALAGERFDGHDFLAEVAAAGAGCLVIRRETPQGKLPAVPCLLVDDTLRALRDLAAYRRQVMKAVSRPLVVGITGSCGKTTVKEMIAAIFDQHWPAPSDQVLKTRGNFNNLVGLPLSLLPIGPGQKAVILEMGMNRPGEIDRLARIADPDIACIVNVHGAHLEGLHSLEGVARAKEELFAASNEGTTLVVNLDDPHVRACAEKYHQKKVCYATGEEGLRLVPQVWVSDIRRAGSIGQTFMLHIGVETIRVTLQVPGVHNISNGVTAAAIAHAAGLSIGEIGVGLGAFKAADKRMQIVKGRGGLYILNDTYNANPASMRAGLATLGQQEGKRRAAILGDMLELGPTSVEAHREVGRDAAAQGVDYLALTGEFAAETALGARMAGLDLERIRIFQEKKAAVAWIEELLAARRLQAGDWLLVKGSRGMRLEEVVEQLMESL